jgi:site-specific DNA-methyltransferase (adenine-specific)
MFCSYHNVDLFKHLLDGQECFKMKNLLVWSKNNWTGGDLKSFAPKHELIWYYTKGRVEIKGARSPDIISFDRVPPTNHPTEKPVLLLEYYIRKLTEMNAIVFDGFMGSGATAIAALKSGRNFVGAELDNEYYNIADKHIKKVQHEQQTFNLPPERDDVFLEKYDVVTAMTDDERRRKKKVDQSGEKCDIDWML